MDMVTKTVSWVYKFKVSAKVPDKFEQTLFQVQSTWLNVELLCRNHPKYFFQDKLTTPRYVYLNSKHQT